MIDLRPLIHRFVDDVLQALQDASVDELRDLVGDRTRERRPERASARQSGPRRAGATASRRSGRPRLRPHVHGVSGAPQHEPHPAVADITDPEALLAAASADTVAKAPQPLRTAAELLEPEPLLAGARLEQHAAAVETAPETPAPSEPPPPPSGAKLVLRPDESLVRATDHGVIIRRRKRVAT